jgi:hypothetical protein
MDTKKTFIVTVVLFIVTFVVTLFLFLHSALLHSAFLNYLTIAEA